MSLSLRTCLTVLALPLLGVLPAYGQQYGRPGPGDDAAAAATVASCFACWGIMIVIPIAFLLLHIFMLVWIYKDSKSSGMDDSVIWLLIACFVPLVGLIVYLCVRPKGEKVVCPSCGNKRLQGLAKCPHCGNP